ncbi:MAG: M56 family metallopeptidase [Oscillospiraceae bacterium]
MLQFIVNLGLCSVVMTAVAACWFGITRAIGTRQRAKWRYYPWLAVLVGFLTPFKPSFGAPVVELETAQTAAQTAVQTTASQSASAVTVAAQGIGWAEILCAVWLCGAAVMLMYSVAVQAGFRKLCRRHAYCADETAIDAAQRISAGYGVKKEVRLFILPVIASPMMTGFFCPTVYLPARAFTDEELRLILKHELTHFQRKDVWIKLLLTVCRMVHWFNPFLPQIVKAIEQDCELSCDEAVMHGETEESAKLYCQCLLNTVLAQNRMARDASSRVLATNFHSGKQSLKARMARIVTGGKRKRFFAVCVVITVLTICSGTLFAFADSSHKNSGANSTSSPTAQVTTVKPAQTQTSAKTSSAVTTTTAKSAQSQPATHSVTTAPETTTAPVNTEPPITTVPKDTTPRETSAFDDGKPFETHKLSDEQSAAVSTTSGTNATTTRSLTTRAE